MQRVAAAACLLLSAAGCGAVGPQEKTCTLIGCNSGLTVHLNAKPTGTFNVEVFAVSPNQQRNLSMKMRRTG